MHIIMKNNAFDESVIFHECPLTQLQAPEVDS